MESIIQNEKKCLLCGSEMGLERHHVFFGNPNRKKSEENGLWVWLCPDCHRGPLGVHRNRRTDMMVKLIGQEAWRASGGTVDDFRAIFGKWWSE